ncbi:translation elongation factor 4 [Syntrophomonas wolfei]|uniref:Elongation factor 4 n=1 Tax=Syntrophomonas wolfei subsp. wolfei (strain DSM 2245B / Goettingen) TaxID=335541 RepID=LEPA_SYNWW|nr:translation elongation factor 4 [Syntrophomonas wolfei]Q0AWL9.1 RecName: Full=Elongation factor 4; Short=EF-4; AltName: Full=Ribosomal back-translocase LepA [Syntrophomonas wolfei subsp. wolfei str. Goettingen G311]ABI68885.1 GTP-binding protein LepA [Syntrophomonas wolfei subsp. wolfei str. Goettingen G311]
MQKNIRNFSIIAHIDHGKSTLADRLLHLTGALSDREMKEQFLDKMELEREKGITIKLKPVRLNYRARDGQEYILNLIDTPGHVDFSYEVSRSLAACEGALLVVDASQGIEAQTLANVYMAMDLDLEIIGVVNKIDLPGAEPEVVKQEMENVLGLDQDEVLPISAKLGTGVEDVLEAIVERIPPPSGDKEAALKALIFDSYFDPYKGAISYIRVVEGELRQGDMIRMMSSGKEYEVDEIGVLSPYMTEVEVLSSGEVGYVAAGMKNVNDTRVGDTITGARRAAPEALSGYQEVKPMVYCGLYPLENSEFERLRDALDRLKLNDASLFYEPDNSDALGFGFRCGFLGLLHLEIVKERLEREYDLSLLATAPSVIYRVLLTDGSELMVQNPTHWPPPQKIDRVMEPYVKASIMVPNDYVGTIMELCQEKRGSFITMEYLTSHRVVINYRLPLAEILYDFFDALKSRTRGYASLDYEFHGFDTSDLIKLDIMLNGEVVDALSFIVHEDKAYYRARAIVNKLRKIIPRQMYEVAIQAAIGNRILARENIKAMRKDVLAKCYGGDITRKKKLLEKQKEGKKRMKQIGRVEVPKDAFMTVLDIEND